VRRKDVAQRTDAGYKKILLLKKPMVYVCCMTIHEARLQLTAALYEVYAHSEAETIAAMVLEKITGWQKPDRIFNKKVPLNIQQAAGIYRCFITKPPSAICVARSMVLQMAFLCK
jgi:hypothetical protein